MTRKREYFSDVRLAKKRAKARSEGEDNMAAVLKRDKCDYVVCDVDDLMTWKHPFVETYEDGQRNHNLQYIGGR